VATSTRAPLLAQREGERARYLNSIVEQDHRAIKRRCASMAGFKSFVNAAVTIAGVELAHRIRKRQAMLSRTYRRLGSWSLKNEWAMALA
jgi:transposase-like protein